MDTTTKIEIAEANLQHFVRNGQDGRESAAGKVGKDPIRTLWAMEGDLQAAAEGALANELLIALGRLDTPEAKLDLIAEFAERQTERLVRGEFMPSSTSMLSNAMSAIEGQATLRVLDTVAHLVGEARR